MIRTQIQLTQPQFDALKRLAGKQGTSLSELIRQGIDNFLHISKLNRREDKWKRALSVIGQFSSGPPDLAEKHDEYFYESLKE